MFPNHIRKNLHLKRFSYDTQRYNFKEILDNLMGCDVSLLHKKLGDVKAFTRASDQGTLAHSVFYSNFEGAFRSTYELFIREVIKEIVQEEFYYQVIPTFRVGLPGNRFVGEYHTDTKYNHQTYEVNFNVGICNYESGASLKTQLFPGSESMTLVECPYGEIFSFDHIDCVHGSEPNPSELTMCSFDFRLAIKSLYYDSSAHSVNTRSSFKPGSYFSDFSL